MPLSDDVAIADVPDLHRFELHADEELAGFSEYLDHNQQRIFYPTEVDRRYSGRGLANTLIRSALTETTSAGLRIVPVCPLVAKYLKKHDGFTNAVDPVTPDAIAFIRSSRS